MEDTKLPLEQARAFMAVLEQLCRNPVAVDFHLPVATLFPEVDQEYSKVIEHPMDLSTVVSNLRNGRYKDSKRLIRHVHRIFLNCKKFNLKSNRIFYNRADHLSDYFDSLLAERGLGGAGGGGGGGGGGGDALALPARRRLACHQAAARAPLRGRWLARAVAAVEGCGLPLGPAARAALGAVRAKGEVEYRQFLELALALFGYDPKANPLGVVFDQLAADHHPPGAPAAAAAEGEGAAAAAAQGAAAAAAAGRQWAAVERALLAVAAEALELMFRGNDFSCVWGVPWRFVWAKTRAKEALWPAIVLADADAPPEVEAINMRRVPRGIVSELRRQKARTPDPVLVEFFGTNEFAWVREGLLEPFRGRGDRRTTLPQGPKRERWGAAVYDLDLALRDLKETFAAAADPLPAKKGHKDGGGGGAGAPELPPQLRFEIDAAAFAGGAADPDSGVSDFEEDAELGAQRERSATPGGRRASLGGSAPPSPSSSSFARGGGGGGAAAGAGGRLVGRRFKPALLRRLAAFSALCREDPEFLAAYDLDKAGAREEKRRERAARRGRLVARVGAFVAAVRRETPDFDEAYELDKISPYRRRMALIEERIAQKTARLPRKYTLPPPPVAGGTGGGAKAGAGGGAGKPLRKEDYQSIVTVTPSLWRAYEVYHRGRAPRAQDALEFYVNLHPRALAQKVEFCRNLKKPPPPAAEEEDKEGEKGDLEGATDSEEEEEEEGEGGEGGGSAAAAAPLEGRHYPEGPESHPRCADRKAYLRALAGLLAADLAALCPLRRAARRALAHPAVAPPPPPGEAVSKGQKRPAPSSAAGGGKGGAVAKKQKALPKVAVAAKATMALKNQVQNGSGAGGASPGGSGPPKREYKTSKYRGVCFQANAFIARISVDGKVQSLGRFGTEAEAARAYDRRARQVFGKRAMTNFNADGEENHYDASYMNQHGMEHPDSISESSDEEGKKGTSSKSNNAERSYSFSDSGDGSSGSEAEQAPALASRRPAASASSFIIPA